MLQKTKMTFLRLFAIIAFAVLLVIASIGLASCSSSERTVTGITYENGELVVTYSDGESESLGSVAGATGGTGATGATGAAGNGISDIYVSEDGTQLIVVLDDNTTKEIDISDLVVSKEDLCEHDYLKVLTVQEATCYCEGLDLYVCQKNCGSAILVATDMLTTHTYVATADSVTLPDCYSDGYITYTCKYCKTASYTVTYDATNKKYVTTESGVTVDQTECATLVSTAISNYVTSTKAATEKYTSAVAYKAEYNRALAIQTQGTLEQLEHSGENDYLEITIVDDGKNICEDGGRLLQVCKYCLAYDGTDYDEDAVYGVSVIAATGHNVTSDWEVADKPTLTSEGTLVGYCSKCGTTATVTLPKLTSTEAAYSGNYVYTGSTWSHETTQEASCITGDEQIITYTIKIGNKTVEIDVVTEATHKVNGYNILIDSDHTLYIEINGVYSDQATMSDLLTLLNGEGFANSEANCLSDGYGYVYCSVCGDRLLAKVSGDHTPDGKGAYSSQESTCSVAGYDEYYCTVCEQYYKVPRALLSAFEAGVDVKYYNANGVEVDGTVSSEVATIELICKGCDGTVDGHKITAVHYVAVTTKTTSCAADGEVVYYYWTTAQSEYIYDATQGTVNYDGTVTVAIPSLGHTYTIYSTSGTALYDVSYSVTSDNKITVNIYYAGTTTVVDKYSNYVLSETNTIESTYVNQFYSNATNYDCQTAEFGGLVCSVCGNTTLLYGTDANGDDYKLMVGPHTYVKSGSYVDATCTEEGYQLYVCSVCGDRYKGDKVAALGHNYSTYELSYDSNGNITGITLICSHDKTHTVYYDCVYVAFDPSTCSEYGTIYIWTTSEVDWTKVSTYTFTYEVNGSLVSVTGTKGSDGKITYTTEAVAATGATANYHNFGVTIQLAKSYHHSYNGIELDSTITVTYNIEEFLDDEDYTITQQTDVNGNDYLEILYNGSYVTMLEFFTNSPNNCLEEGYAYMICRDCGAKVLVKIIGAHDWDTSETYHYDGGCTEASYDYYICLNDTDLDPTSEHNKIFNVEEATGHVFEYEITDPTETTEGSLIVTCANCDYKEEYVLPVVSEANGYTKTTSDYSHTVEWKYTIKWTYTITNEKAEEVTTTKTITIYTTTDHDEAGATKFYTWSEKGYIYEGYLCNICSQIIVTSMVEDPDYDPSADEPTTGDEPTTTVEAHTSSLNIEELVTAIETRTAASIADKTQLATTDFTGSNAFLTLTAEKSSNQYRTSNNGVIEIKDDGLAVTFTGTGTITISFASTGTSNYSTLGLVDAAGNYIAGTSTDATVDGSYFGVTGSSTYVTVTFTVTEAGTYYIKTNNGTEGRGARISSIVMVDNY